MLGEMYWRDGSEVKGVLLALPVGLSSILSTHFEKLTTLKPQLQKF